MPQNKLKESEEKMGKAINALKRELVTVRAGRATPAILDKVNIDYYGSPTPISQVASITAPEPRMLIIQPWDKSSLSLIDKAIMKADLGLTPTNDGTVIRIVIPALTQERRKELTKMVKKYGEEAKVAIRNIRREANEGFKKLEKEGTITEDEMKRFQDKVQKNTDKYVEEIDKTVAEKDKEIMEV